MPRRRGWTVGWVPTRFELNCVIYSSGEKTCCMWLVAYMRLRSVIHLLFDASPWRVEAGYRGNTPPTKAVTCLSYLSKPVRIHDELKQERDSDDSRSKISLTSACAQISYAIVTMFAARRLVVSAAGR